VMLVPARKERKVPMGVGPPFAHALV